MKATTNTTTGYRIERLQGNIPTNKVVKLYGTVGNFLAGKDVIIKGHHTNAQGVVLYVETASSTSQSVQAYGNTGIATYADQSEADQDFADKKAEYEAASEASNWDACRELKEANG